MYDLILKGASLVLPSPHGLVIEKQNLAIKDGLISYVGPEEREASKVLFLKGLHILPGLIDTQVHFREPGNPQKEDLERGTLSAIAGGITAVFEMPNTSPPTTTVQALEDKLKRSENRRWCHLAFFIGACSENANQLDQLEKQKGCCGVKIFMGSSTGNLLLANDEDLETAFRTSKRRMALHCEDEKRLKERFCFAKKNDVTTHPVWRDELTALNATKKATFLAQKYKRPIHVLHVTTAEEMEYLKDFKQWASVECTPQHLTLTAPQCYEQLQTKAQMNPPIRGQRHKEALWKAVENSVVDMIGSDHAPHTLEEKQKSYPESPSGMTGVQTTVPVMLNHHHEKRISLEKIVELMAENPSRLYKIKNKGRIEVGKDADLTIVDLKKENVIENQWIRSRCGWTPFDGMKVTGWPEMVFLKGKMVMNQDEILGPPQGDILEFF